jgi:hypothetical protein
MIVRFPLTTAPKPRAKAVRAVASSDESGWLTAKEPAKKRKASAATKKKAAAAKKKAAPKKKKTAPKKKAATAKVVNAKKPAAVTRVAAPAKKAPTSILESLGGRPGQQIIELSSDDEDSDDTEFEFE